MNTRFGIQEESDEDNESDKEDEEEGPYSEGEGISDDMDHKSAESDMDEDLDQEQRWDRAAFPSKRLPPGLVRFSRKTAPLKPRSKATNT